MTKEEFLTKLSNGLSGYPAKDREEYLLFYGEMIDDRMEEGLTEEDAVGEIGTADLRFLPSEDGKCPVVCYEPENAVHSVSVSDGTLTVSSGNDRKWTDYIGITTDSPKITVSQTKAGAG